MPSRRRFLQATGVSGLAVLAGCSGLDPLGRPAVRRESGIGTLHPATDRHIAHGLQPGGTDDVFARVVPNRAPEYVGPAASDHLRDRLERAESDVFHVVVQLRSTPEAPIQLTVEDVGWRNRQTLVCRVSVEPWGSLSAIDDREVRARLQSADELVYTSVWSLTPELDTLPSHLDLSLAHR